MDVRNDFTALKSRTGTEALSEQIAYLEDSNSLALVEHKPSRPSRYPSGIWYRMSTLHCGLSTPEFSQRPLLRTIVVMTSREFLNIPRPYWPCPSDAS